MGLASDQCLDLSRIALRQDHDPQWFHIPVAPAKLGSVVGHQAARGTPSCTVPGEPPDRVHRISHRVVIAPPAAEHQLAVRPGGPTLPRWGRVVVYGVISCKRIRNDVRDSPHTGRPTDDWMSM
jgi:hypothetical protein